MNKDLLLTYCRYYKGEKECPFSDPNDVMFWEYEKNWHEMQKSRSESLIGYIDEYISDGLASFELEGDRTPISIKALLWNRYSHWNYPNADGFKKWYTQTYYKKAEL